MQAYMCLGSVPSALAQHHVSQGCMRQGHSAGNTHRRPTATDWVALVTWTPTQMHASRAIRELLAGLEDPFTRFVTPQQFQALMVFDVTGVGLNLGSTDEFQRKVGFDRPVESYPSDVRPQLEQMRCLGFPRGMSTVHRAAVEPGAALCMLAQRVAKFLDEGVRLQTVIC